jgi:hypothetical protein
MKTIKPLLLIWVVLLTACFTEDEPVPPYVSPPGVISQVIEMGPSYGTQHFYDLESDSVLAVVDRSSWDIALGSSNLNRSIYVNSSKLMKVCDLGPVNFETALLPQQPVWKIDASSGDIDSTGIGFWAEGNPGSLSSKNHVYVLDLGFSTLGEALGKMKLQMLGFQNGAYRIRFSGYPSGPIHELSIPINLDYSFMYATLSGNGAVVSVAPAASEWDLLFSQYTTMVPNPDNGIPEAYSVNGILLNPQGVSAARAFDGVFDSLGISDLPFYALSSQWDLIGYDWKRYDFNTASYLIQTNNLYLIRNRMGNYFKLRFTGFVNPFGQSGHIGFELKKL